MQNSKNKIFIYTALTFFLVVSFALGFFVGKKDLAFIDRIRNVAGRDTEVVTSADFGPFWKVWNVLNDKSIYIKEVEDQEKVWDAIKGLASSVGDPYTVFFSPEENKLFQDEIHGSFSGIGAEISKKDGVLTVVSPLKDTPAEKSGLQSKDKILMIDNKDARDFTIDQAISAIRGPKGTAVLLTILREGDKKTKDISIVRDDIDIPTIKTEIKDDVFVIHFYTFSENSASLFKNAMNEFISSGLKKLIIDLRSNPGGYLDSAIEITGWFLDTGKVVAIQDFGENKKREVFRSHGPRLFNKDYKLAILVNGGSASASEIMAGALVEHGVAKLVGESTFGKGSVQELVSITSDTSLKVTVAKWLTPNGSSISESGLTPDYKVDMTLEEYNQGIDPQLNKAIEILK